MKKLILLISVLTITAAFPQSSWQDMMFDRDANFYDVQKEFSEYQDNILSNPNRIPKGKGIKQFKRWEYYWETRVDEFGNFPSPGHVLNEVENYNNTHAISAE